MTRPVLSKIKCAKCGMDVRCLNCGTEIDSMTPFSHWLRALPGDLSSKNFDNENLDYIWFHYRLGWFITIEEKRYLGHCTSAQMDTHGVITQMLTMSSGRFVQTMRGNRAIQYRGHYVIRFSDTTPDDSKVILINEIDATRDDILYLLKNGRLP